MRLPTDKSTGNLIWRDKASQIDRPFADFIEDLMAPLPGQRPQTTGVILQRLERLPFKSKLNRLIKSRLFRVGVGVFGFLSIATLIYASLPLVANYYLNEGKKLNNKIGLRKQKVIFKKQLI